MQTNLLEAIERTVEAKREDNFATWYNEKGKDTERRSFGQVWDEAGVVAYWNVKKGDRVILCYGFGLHFFSVFVGCLRAGVTAVLVYPPTPPLHLHTVAGRDKEASQHRPSLRCGVHDQDCHRETCQRV